MILRVSTLAMCLILPLVANAQVRIGVDTLGNTSTVPTFVARTSRGKIPPPKCLHTSYSREWMGKFNLDIVMGKDAQAMANRLIIDFSKTVPMNQKGVITDEVTIMQTLSDEKAILKVRVGRYETKLVMGKGFDFTNSVDDARFDPGVVEVVGTEKYSTAIGGSNKVYVISPPKGQLQALAKIPLPFACEWADTRDNSKLMGSYYGFENGEVQFVDREWDTFEIPITKLNKEDKSHVMSLLKDFREANRWLRKYQVTIETLARETYEQ